MKPSDQSSPLEEAARQAGVRDPRVLAAFREILRTEFVPVASAHLAERDRPIPIPNGQVTTQPSLVALMVEALELRGGEHVLEVGTGFGYQTAILAELCAHVYSIERFADLSASAAENLRRAGIENVTLIVGDGTRGVPEHAPYDAIVVAAAATTVSPRLAEQLQEGRILVQPIGPGGSEMVTAFRRRGGLLVRERAVSAAYFVPLVGGDVP